MKREPEIAFKKPNFFVVGAPKSGTTSLYFYLKSHPRIFLPRRKELLFFCDDLHFTFPLLNERQFLEYYSGVTNQTAIGEVSVWNLYSANAARNISQFNPDSRIIIMLRNPVDMLHALHSNHVFNSNETIADFEQALNAEVDRKAGRQISPVIRCPVEGLFYSEVASYAQQVQRYYRFFGKEKVLVILFDDFINSTKEAYNDILRFLEIEDRYTTEFKIYNANKTIKSRFLKHVTINPPQWLKATGKVLFPHQSKKRDQLMQLLWKINTKQADKPVIKEDLRLKLSNRFRTEIHDLSKVIDRDLSQWLQ